MISTLVRGTVLTGAILIDDIDVVVICVVDVDDLNLARVLLITCI